MVNVDQHIWISAYLFHEKSANEFLIEFVQPFLEKMKLEKELLRYFFIRYYEDGPHIRLRLLVKKNVERKWKKRLQEEREAYYFEENSLVTDKGCPNSGIRLVEYTPEVDRYGGMEVISAAELQFESCSEVALKSLLQYSKNWKDNTAFFLAIKMHLISFVSMGFSDEDMKKTCKFFIQEWLPSLYDISKPEEEQQQFFLSEFSKKFDIYKQQMVFAVCTFLKDIKTSAPEDIVLNTYYLENKDVGKRYSNKQLNLSIESSIATSFMHMTHNRLGIINTDEAFLVYLLYKCLENNNIDE
ncbi:thiopeptide-type bacteriocin biosynthesis protein [Aquimarina sp. MAR_2010_214]|uniref:thiopeptide-type bacteriocin biosynthesis protein n=1 Tax=Aquimarina sp. MAR_2010_214 TaxID=1250026 RepID=UPI000C705D91|nr:thiopeptide-type bacteriocin biosynthesis protein [Aquimarina sp. MAR_2010_214]PKV52596.1 thiopeptide-type bacteriocin biosynthesis protein [Aquimarina sp. MAR_2010_214]